MKLKYVVVKLTCILIASNIVINLTLLFNHRGKSPSRKEHKKHESSTNGITQLQMTLIN